MPSDPSRVKGWPRIKAALLPLFCAAAIGGWLGFGVVPDLATDLAAASAAQPVPQARLVSGRCRTRFALLHDCELELAVRTPQGEVTRKVGYLFATFQTGSFSVEQIYAPPDRPAVLIADIGLDRLLNRTVFALVMAGLALGSLAWAVSALRGKG